MTKNEICSKCDSTSQEMCLLIRHCPLWVDRHETKEEIKTKYKQGWIQRALEEDD